MRPFTITSFLVFVLAATAIGQTGPAFEVASVKHAAGGGPPGDIPRNMDSSPGHFAMRNVPLRYAVEWAWDLKDYEISGPDWIRGDERYDIIAKASGAATDEQMKPMLQALLLERFQMKIRRETKDLPVYVLAPGKGPAKVTTPAPDAQTRISGTAAGAHFEKQPMSRLTFLLTRRLDRPVLDKTGLTGMYDYTLDLSGLPTPEHPMGEEGTSIFSAIQKDLGLKLEARKEPISILVIDQVSKIPTAN